MPETVLTRRQLNRALLARQLLLERSSRSPLAVIEHLVGMQAQLPTPPYYGLWTRLVDFDPHAVSHLFLDRQVVRLSLMRSTVHLVSARDALVLRPTLAQAVVRGMTPGSPYGKALAGIDLTELGRRGRALVEAEPLTGNEVALALQDHWPGVDLKALAFAVRALVPLVQVPPRGTWGGVGQSRTTSLEHWLGQPLAEPDAAQLVRRYLGAYGPASVRDAQAWSGLTGLGAVFKSIRNELLLFRDEAGVELFDLIDAPRPAARSAAPVRLLPDFDQILLAHADRSRIFDPVHKDLIFSNNGIIRASVLVDGFVRALWTLDVTRAGATLRVTPLPGPPLRPAEQTAISREAGRLLEFAAPGSPPSVTFGPLPG